MTPIDDDPILPSVTEILRRASHGDSQAMEQCYLLVQDELHRIAMSRMSDRDHVSLDATMVVNDAWLDLIVDQDIDWESRRQFYRYAAQTVRNLLCDHARRRTTQKRSPGTRHVSLSSIAAPVDPGKTPSQVHANAERDLQLAQAIDRLQHAHPDLAMVVELHHYGGWSLSKIASHILDLDVSTVRRRWNRAKIVLKAYMDGTV